MGEYDPDEINEFEKTIIEAFEVFDHSSSQTVDVREIGTIIRSLGCCPSEAEIQEILVKVEDAEVQGSVHLDRFMDIVSQIIKERKLEPASPEKLLKAFQTLDPEGNGYLTKDFLSKLMMEEGEQFTQEEVDEMMAVAVDPETGHIPYEYYINQLMVDRTKDIYSKIPVKREDPRKKRLMQAFAQLKRSLHGRLASTMDVRKSYADLRRLQLSRMSASMFYP